MDKGLEMLMNAVPFMVGGAAIGASLGTLMTYYMSSGIIGRIAENAGVEFAKEYVKNRINYIKSKNLIDRKIVLAGTMMACERFLSRFS